MQTKIILLRVLLVITFLALSFSVFSYVRWESTVSSDLILVPPDVVLPVVKQQERLALPVRLKIPKINVDAAIVYTGLTPEGAMGVPNGPTEVAWFSFGARPGENGSAVIAGHFGWKGDIPAVFDQLHELQEGDRLYVENENGVISTFVVRDIRSFDPEADASDVFASNDGKAHLNLVTCEGEWSVLKKSRPSRIVVFTDKE